MSERVQDYIDTQRRQEAERADRDRRARERDGCNQVDAYIARFDDPDREPMNA